MVYEYYKLAQILSTNDTKYNKGESYIQTRIQECKEIMQNDIAMVKVRLESNKYMKTIKDKRLTFADKLASFGNLVLTLVYNLFYLLPKIWIEK